MKIYLIITYLIKLTNKRMKKILLSLVALFASVIANAFTFDFSQFADGVDATGNTPVMTDGFSFVGNNSKVTLTKSGFYTGGSSSATARHIVFTPEKNVTLTVEATASGDNTDRFVAIADVACSPAADGSNVIAKTMMPAKGTRVKVSANLKAGTTYYIVLYGNGTVTGISYEESAPAVNTVEAGKYIAEVTIAEAEGVTAPDNFKAYVGTHKYGMDLAGDEKSLTISGLNILNNFEIVGDAVAYDPTMTFTMNGKDFTICSVDGTKTEGTLAVTKNADGSISIEDFGFMRSGIFAGTAKNITAVIPEYVEAEANITFEDVDLQGETYYDGSDGAGLIATAGEFSFMNYNPGTYWNGFAVSATRSNVYSGNWGDDTQFNSIVAGGMQSEKFAVGYYSEWDAAMNDQYPEIYATKNIKPEYVYITNTAWAVTSMMNGDNYAKVFDETDWFKVTISGMVFDEDEEDYVVQSSVDFYLAKDGNIVKEWTKVDLTPLGICEFIRFTMDSSDKLGFINTPCYFALDNMKAVSTDEPTVVKGVAEAKAAQKVSKFVKGGKIVIVKDGVEYNAAGAVIK